MDARELDKSSRMYTSRGELRSDTKVMLNFSAISNRIKGRYMIICKNVHVYVRFMCRYVCVNACIIYKSAYFCYSKKNKLETKRKA